MDIPADTPIDAWENEELCNSCGDEWGNHSGTSCPVGGTKFTTNAAPLKYGWWSDNQAALSSGYSVYRAPDGTEHNVSMVTSGSTHNTAWSDIRYVARVRDWVRNISGAPKPYRSPGISAPHPPVNATIQSQPEPKQVVSIRGDVDMELDWSNNKKASAPTAAAPCPKAYTGAGDCTCGKCPKNKKITSNPFGY